MALEVTDSSDWIGTRLESLVAVDSALRCQVCKELYESPMITTCAHTFCSLCIRRSLSNDSKCPLCRATDQPNKLRKNNAVEEMVQAFKIARPEILQLGRDVESAAKATVVQGRKRKAAEAAIEHEQVPSPRKTRSAGRLAPRPNANASSIELADSEEKTEVLDSPPAPTPKDDGLVPCPLCQRRMAEAAVFVHLDICKGPESSPKVQQNAFSLRGNNPTNEAPKLEPLPGLNYSMLKEKDFRQRLDASGLPSTGSRAIMQRRHAEWINIWNANCDSTRPKSKRELLRDLDKWERTQNRAPNGAPTVMDKDFDGETWAKSHNDDFKSLIAKARQKPKRMPESESEGGTEQSKGAERGVAEANDVVDEGMINEEIRPIEDETATLLIGIGDATT